MASTSDDAAYAIATSVPELNVTSAVIVAAARHLGEGCKEANQAYMACKTANGGDPKPCMAQGKDVTICTRDFFKALKASCGAEFQAQWNCIDENNQEYAKCRKTQNAMDNCVFEKMGLHGAFQTYDTDRSYSSYND